MRNQPDNQTEVRYQRGGVGCMMEGGTLCIGWDPERSFFDQHFGLIRGYKSLPQASPRQENNFLAVMSARLRHGEH